MEEWKRLRAAFHYGRFFFGDLVVLTPWQEVLLGQKPTQMPHSSEQRSVFVQRAEVTWHAASQ